MIDLRTSADMDRLLKETPDRLLRDLLNKRVGQLAEYDGYDLSELAHFLIVQPGDDLQAIEGELAFPLATNFVDGIKFGEVGFEPSWEWLEDHDGWFEMPFVFTDDGFGWVLLVPDQEGVDPTLLKLCRAYAVKAPI